MLLKPQIVIYGFILIQTNEFLVPKYVGHFVNKNNFWVKATEKLSSQKYYPS